MGNGSGITGLVLSIFGLALAIIGPLLIAPFLKDLIAYPVIIDLLWLILPGVGVILSIVGIATNDSKAPGIVGLIFGIAGILVALLCIFIVSLLSMIMSSIF
ncbi:MAG: hypothetical protein ACFFBP_02830 [Promethearchaeota archaeon]